MEAIAALGLACNVMQVISFSRDIFIVARSVYASGKVEEELSDKSSHLANLALAVEDSMQSASKPQTKAQQDLQEAARKCHQAAVELGGEIDAICLASGSQRPRLFKAIKSSLGAVSRKHKLRDLEKTTWHWEKMIDSGLLLQICSQNEARAIHDRQDFSLFDDNLRHLVDNLALGQAKLATLITQESEAIQSHVSQEISRSEHLVTTRIGDHAKETQVAISGELRHLSLSRERREAEAKLLASLRFPGMAEREVAVVEAVPSTYEWIFSTQMHQWDNFLAWLGSDEKMYLVSGKPGSGKSTLMKFLASHRRTSEILPPSAIVISHYFWRHGATLQRAIRGLFLSLLYQILDKDRSLMDPLLAEADSVQKTEHHDWPLPALESSLAKALNACRLPVCMFVDGLDEVDPKDRPFELFKSLDKLYAIDHVKACISSRPEPAFQKKFAGRRRLRLQDLTKSDMEMVCYERLDPFRDDIPRDWRFEHHHSLGLDGLVEMLVAKTEGVFLWVHLVLQSVQRGFANGDPIEDMLRRLETLPEDLDELYYDMWKRANVDRGIYEKEAASILNLVLNVQDLAHFTFKHVTSVSVLELMLAQHPHLRTAILDGSAFSTQDIDSACEAMKRSVETRCFGIVEIKPAATLGVEGFVFETGTPEFDVLVPHTDMCFTFVHRSAADFLRQSDRGIELLSADNSTVSDRLVNLHISAIPVFKIWRYAPCPTSVTVFTSARMCYSRAFLWLRGISHVSDRISGDGHRQVAMVGEKLWMGVVNPVLKADFGVWKEDIYLDDFVGVSAFMGNLGMIKAKLDQIETGPRKIGRQYLSYLLQRCNQFEFRSIDVKVWSSRLDVADWALSRGADSMVPFLSGLCHSLPICRPYHVASALQGLVVAAITVGSIDRDSTMPLLRRMCQIIGRMLVDTNIKLDTRIVVRLSWLVGSGLGFSIFYSPELQGRDQHGSLNVADGVISLTVGNFLGWFVEFLGTLHPQLEVPGPLATLAGRASDQPLQLLCFKSLADHWTTWRKPTEAISVGRTLVWSELRQVLEDPPPHWGVGQDTLLPAIYIMLAASPSTVLETEHDISEALRGSADECLDFAHPTPSYFD